MPDTNDHSISWWITKRTPTFTLNSNSVNLQDSDGQRSSTIVVNHQGNGKISAVSDDLSIASTYVSGDNVTVTRQGEGNAKVYVMVGSDTAYKIPPSQIVSVNCGADAIIQSTCNVVITRITTDTLRYADTCIFDVTRSGNADISFAADGDNKISVTKSENITNGKRFTVKWQCTGTVKLTATVAESVYYKSGTASVNCTVYGKLPNLSINDVTVTALSSTQATFSLEGNGVVTVKSPYAVSQYVSIESDTATRFTFKGLKMGSSEVTATVAADGIYGSDTCKFKVTVNGASRTFSCTDITATTLNDAFIFVPATSDKGSVRFKDFSSENPDFVYNNWMYDLTDGSIQIWTNKAGKAKINFTVYDPDDVYADVKHFCYVTVVKRDRNVSFNSPSDIQMYYSETIDVAYDGDGDITANNVSKLNVSVSGKKIICTPAGVGTGKFNFSIPANDYYNAYNSGDVSVTVSKCKDRTWKIFYTTESISNINDLTEDELTLIRTSYGEQYKQINIYVTNLIPNKPVNLFVFFYANDKEISRLQPYSIEWTSEATAQNVTISAVNNGLIVRGGRGDPDAFAQSVACGYLTVNMLNEYGTFIGFNDDEEYNRNILVYGHYSTEE